MAPWAGHGLGEAGEGTLRHVSAQARLRTPLETVEHCSWEGFGLLKGPIPAVQMGRLKPRGEGKTPKAWGD